MKIPPHLIERIRKIEKDVDNAYRSGNVEIAIQSLGALQELFSFKRNHFRLLRSKLKVFELCIDSGRLHYAESGIIGVNKLCSDSSRLYIESASLLSITYLRMKKLEEAKKHAHVVISKINNIKSDQKRREYQKEFINRIEEECVFSALIESGGDKITPELIHEEAVKIVKSNDKESILTLIGNNVPTQGATMLSEMRNLTVASVRKEDQKLLPPPQKKAPSKEIGVKALAVLKRIGWQALCHPESQIYQLWSKQIPSVYSSAYFASSITTVMKDWRISLTMLGAGIVAIVMQYSAKEFCALTKPQGIILSKSN